MGLQEDYQALIDKQFKEWQLQAERFREAAQHMEAQARAQFEKNLELLRATQAQAWDNFSKLRSANDGIWAEFKAHMDRAGTELRQAAEALTRGFQPPPRG